MHVTVITPPAAIVSLDDAKLRLRVDHSDDDALITALIAAATSWIDGPTGWLGRSIGQQTLELRTDGFRAKPLQLPFGPIISVTSVKYLDGEGAEQTVAGADYEKLSDGRVVLAPNASWPSTYSNDEAVRVRYVAGYPNVGDPAVSTVPEAIKTAVLLMVGYLYENREATTDQALNSGSVRALLSIYRVWSV